MLDVVCITLWDVEDDNESNDQHNRPDDNKSGSGGSYKLKRSQPGGRITEIRQPLMIKCITIVRTKSFERNYVF